MRRNITRVSVNRKQREQRYAIREWSGRLKDVPAFIIGNAPSAKEHDLSLLDKYFTIGINRAFKLSAGPTASLDPTILFWQDISLWTTEYHNLHNLQAIKVARDIADPKRIYYNFHLKGGPYKFDEEKSTSLLFGRGSSFPLAVQMAWALGCRPICIIGCDCLKGADGQTDFYGNNPWHGSHTMHHCRLGLEFVKNHSPVEILSAGNAVDLWPRMELPDMIKNSDPTGQWRIGRKGYASLLLKKT